ncbi:unnamed protein product [Phytomonas sp. EM1]|nr:unnamed protein product [Phytomonas sp. EM1]|eukprot:CCW61349.1 unnamed protein product [Phytomonas sp. isolate EM1]
MVSPEDRFPSDTRVVLRGLNGDFKVDKTKYHIVQCSDEKYVEVLIEQAKQCPFITPSTNESGIFSFKYPAPVLENLVRWTAKYGLDGFANSKIARPCIYREFSCVLTDDWDFDFFNRRLWTSKNYKYFLITMNAAEEYNIKGLLDLMEAALSCKIRSEDESTIVNEVMGIEKDVEITDELLNNVSDTYPWFQDLITPS